MKVVADPDAGSLVLTGLTPDEVADWFAVFHQMDKTAREGGGDITCTIRVKLHDQVDCRVAVKTDAESGAGGVDP